MLDESTNSSPLYALESNLRGGESLQMRELVAQTMSRNDRRKTPRLTQSAEIRIHQLSPTAATPEGAILGEVRNFSRGGMCIESPVPMVTSSVVQCQIGMPDLRFAIPTLMQVLWVEKTAAAEYAAGLRYLF